MKIHLQEKETRELLPTDIVFQSAFWSDVKSRLGWKPLALDFSSSEADADVLILTKDLSPGISMAYVPQGPEFGPEPDQYGLFLEALSTAISSHLDPKVTFIRYDLPWKSPYVADIAGGSAPGVPFERPEPRLQELRMNFGTKTWNFRKAAVDFTFADRLVLDLEPDEGEILSGMKSKTRYNIRLAQRKGVSVSVASADLLPVFYDLYRQTAKRNHFPPCEAKHFAALFSGEFRGPDSSEETLFLVARHGRDPLAGAILVISGRTATYLFGASSDEKRNFMAPYALQWTAIRMARAKGCRRYDLGAVSPGKEPNHPFFGLYRFKAGFGGKLIHQSGSWDYPLDEETYQVFRNSETIDGILRTI